MPNLEYDLSCPPGLLPGFAEACAPLRELVERVNIGRNQRPGEGPYLIAYVYDNAGRRHGLATPHLLHLPLAEQAPDLCEQLGVLAVRLRVSERHAVLRERLLSSARTQSILELGGMLTPPDGRHVSVDKMNPFESKK